MYTHVTGIENLVVVKHSQRPAGLDNLASRVVDQVVREPRASRGQMQLPATAAEENLRHLVV